MSIPILIGGRCRWPPRFPGEMTRFHTGYWIASTISHILRHRKHVASIPIARGYRQPFIRLEGGRSPFFDAIGPAPPPGRHPSPWVGRRSLLRTRRKLTPGGKQACRLGRGHPPPPRFVAHEHAAASVLPRLVLGPLLHVACRREFHSDPKTQHSADEETFAAAEAEAAAEAKAMAMTQSSLPRQPPTAEPPPAAAAAAAAPGATPPI
eukprot:CAMPEP_0181023686 /NCGR_PEP_ID=MMETSP1070-20121207/2176_1 /TAXON_ID=265543 /ORGANISM="Minutocellus polymorphus, Strain NH13" /LENGTH=207 /DNA_ID=CAMNT_0023100703 /DNA_START=119 /DNA_END=742 /DNA_ORIENTATION=-